ncbi:hypothetical protein NDU88_004359, partial [Pleurodeles waltl]
IWFCKTPAGILCNLCFTFYGRINRRTAPGTVQLQQSIQEGYCNSVTSAPDSNCNSFQVVHALRTSCLHSAPEDQRNLPWSDGATSLLQQAPLCSNDWYSGSPLLMASMDAGAQVVDQSDPDCPKVHLSKFG